MSFMSKKYFSMLLGGTLSMVVSSVLLMSDSIVAGLVIGETGVAGITLVTPLYSAAIFCGSVFAFGIPILYSAETGRFRQQEADRVFGFGILMSALIGAALFAAFCLLGIPYLNSCNPSPAVFAQAKDYLFWMRIAMFLLPWNLLLSGMVYADGDEQITALANTAQGIGNIAASLILGRRMGISGISLASFLFTVVSLGILALHLLRKNNSLRPNLYFSFSLMKRVFRCSIIDAGAYLTLAVFTAVMNAYITARFGADCLILVSAAVLCREFQLVFDGIGEAITPILGVYLAEDCFPGVRAVYRLARKTAIAEGIAAAVFLFLLAPAVPDILGISDPTIGQAAVTGIRILSVGSPFVSLLYLYPSYVLLLDRIRLGLRISMVRDLLLPAPFAVLGGLLFGVNGVFAGLMLASVLAWFGSMGFLRLRYADDAPLLLGARGQNRECLLYDLTVEPYSVQRVRDEISEALEARSYDHSTVFRVMLLFEELFMLIAEKNGKKEIEGECSLLLQEAKIRMITRDTGVIFNPTDDDMAVTSLGSHVLLSIAEQISYEKRYLMTMSFNRTAFEIRAGRKKEAASAE